jgi:2-methylcitrate dehydratase PrpD
MVLRRFAEFAVGQRSAGFDAAVRHAATRAVVDWFSATIAGSNMQPASILRSALLDKGESGPCRLVPGGPRTSARTAALINATASHTAELDDIFREGIYHPGSPTVGAALAAAEHSGASGEDFLRAVAVGYEIGDRIAASTGYVLVAEAGASRGASAIRFTVPEPSTCGASFHNSTRRSCRATASRPFRSSRAAAVAG